jgi:hypothetical protein
MTKTFEIGRTYFARSACDYDTVFTFEVVKRTEKTITIKSRTWGTTSRKIKVWDGVETIMPLGSYSMAPQLSADRPL